MIEFHVVFVFVFVVVGEEDYHEKKTFFESVFVLEMEGGSHPILKS